MAKLVGVGVGIGHDHRKSNGILFVRVCTASLFISCPGDKLLSRRVRMKGKTKFKVTHNMSPSIQTCSTRPRTIAFRLIRWLHSECVSFKRIILLETYFVAPAGSRNAKRRSSRSSRSSYMDLSKIYYCLSSSNEPALRPTLVCAERVTQDLHHPKMRAPRS